MPVLPYASSASQTFPHHLNFGLALSALSALSHRHEELVWPNGADCWRTPGLRHVRQLGPSPGLQRNSKPSRSSRCVKRWVGDWAGQLLLLGPCGRTKKSNASTLLRLTEPCGTHFLTSHARPSAAVVETSPRVTKPSAQQRGNQGSHSRIYFICGQQSAWWTDRVLLVDFGDESVGATNQHQHRAGASGRGGGLLLRPGQGGWLDWVGADGRTVSGRRATWCIAAGRGRAGSSLRGAA